jgi:branched-subunit amino acid aminotransferase/4-amino-4-deoxychorismate lyase
MEMGRDAGMNVEEGLYSAAEFEMADEVFLTNTVSGVVPVTEIDGYVIGSGQPGPRTIGFSKTYLGWLEEGRYGTQCFPEAWKPEGPVSRPQPRSQATPA